MAFVSRNPKTILNPETADGCFVADPKTLAPGTEFIGFYKNSYIDPTYNNKCYVLKGKDDGRDYLFYGSTSLHTEIAHWRYGDLMCISYQGMKENKGGKFAGKAAHIWKVAGDDSREPSPEFVQQLQQEVYYRRLEVQKQLGSQQQGGAQYGQPVPLPQHTTYQANFPQPVHQVNPYHQYPGAPNLNIVTSGYLAPTSVSVGTPNIQQAPVSTTLFQNPYGNKPTDPFG